MSDELTRGNCDSCGGPIQFERGDCASCWSLRETLRRFGRPEVARKILDSIDGTRGAVKSLTV